MRVSPAESFVLLLVLAATLLYLAAPTLQHLPIGQPHALSASEGQVSDLRLALSGYHGSVAPTAVTVRGDRAVVNQRSAWAEARAARRQICLAVRDAGRRCDR